MKKLKLLAAGLAAVLTIGSAPLEINAASKTQVVERDGVEYLIDLTNDFATVTKVKPTTGVVTVPETINGFPVTTVYSDAFCNINANTINLPDCMTEGHLNAKNNPYLISIKYPKNLKTMESKSLENDIQLKSFKIPDKCTNIGVGVFKNCYNLEYVEGLENVSLVWDNCFENCRSLKWATFGTGATSIMDETFKGCESLETLTFPSSIKKIGLRAFNGCNSLKTVNYSGTKEQWNQITGKDQLENINGIKINYYYGSTQLPSVVERDGVIYQIQNDTAKVTGFSNGVTNVNIPEYITDYSDNKYLVTEIDKDCKLPITVVSFKTKLDVPDYFAYNSPNLEKVELGDGAVGKNAFSNIKTLKSVIYDGSQAESKMDSTAFTGSLNVNITYQKPDPVPEPEPEPVPVPEPEPIEQIKQVIKLTGDSKVITYGKKKYDIIDYKKSKIINDLEFKVSKKGYLDIKGNTISGRKCGTVLLSVRVKGSKLAKVTGWKSILVTVKPSTPSIKQKTSKTKVSNSVTMPGCSKFEFKYSNSKKFTNSKTKTVKTSGKLTLTRQKKINRYVKVRTYIKANGKVYYSPWSKVYTVKKK